MESESQSEKHPTDRGKKNCRWKIDNGRCYKGVMFKQKGGGEKTNKQIGTHKKLGIMRIDYHWWEEWDFR